MKKIVVMFASMMLSLALVTNAQEMMGGKKKAAKAKKTTLTGNLIDKACSAKMTSAEAAAGHKKGCSLSDGCTKSGFGVYAGGKYYAFDEAGNGLAKAALEKSAAEMGAMFKVQGTISEDTMAVTKITEVVAKKKKEKA
jgi:hypothetical protein